MQNRGDRQAKLVLFVVLIVMMNMVLIGQPNLAQDAPASYVVQRGEVQDILSFTGQWLPRDQQIMFFPISGTIQSVNVEVGDSVSIGTVLANYGVADLQEALDEAQLVLDTIESSVTSGETANPVLDSQFALASAKLNLQQTLDAIPGTSIVAAKLGLEQAQVALENAERNYNNVIGNPSNEPGAVDGAYQALQAAKAGVVGAQNSYWGAAQSFNLYQYSIIAAENGLLQTEISYENVLQQAASSGPDSILQEAQAEIDRLTAEIAQSSLISPLDGVVLDINVSRGDEITPFQDVMTLALPEPLEVFVNMSAEDSQRLQVGEIGICAAAGRPETAVQCIVRQIPSGNGSGAIRIAASLTDVAQNEIIVVSMPVGVSEDTLWLPPQAIRTFQSRAFVIVQTPSGDETVDITLGLRTSERVEILSGLNEGDIVIAPES